ncbi:hypothetical protein QQS21_006594 [Conoideocrella luteorostrata]|uniref:Uncharacterized protein n=1 Tax=Conoideocrella luteorostrata TaxID=1105319 RepID=A0AAJ0FY51_9HYPO|nr:hypothetical protein QQS21_006594 [Conoideocrella luteorostrata]
MQAAAAAKMSPETTSLSVNHGLDANQTLATSSEQDLTISTALGLGIKSPDDTRSSISSDKSDSKPPRSAMRRSSSISKIPQSPRRVRFDFMGEEVLPTSSPQASAFIAGRISSPEPLDEESDCASHLATEPGEEEGAPPRKVSSSDALRALSRAPLGEDGTVWTVVNSDSDDAGAEASHSTQTNQPEKILAPSVKPNITAKPACLESSSKKMTAHQKPAAPDDAQPASSSPGDESSDDDDVLSMAKHKAPAPLVSRTPALLFATSAAQPAASTQPGSPNARSSKVERPDAAQRRDKAASGSLAKAQNDDEMFYFDEEGLQFPKRAVNQEPTEQKLPTEEDSDQEEDPKDDQEDAMPPNETTSIYATSPPINIPKQWRNNLDDPKLQTSTVGSYKGQPLVMPVVTDPALLEEINSAPVVRGVVDLSDLGSINERLSATVSRSFTRRLLIQDMMGPGKDSSRSPRGAGGRQR